MENLETQIIETRSTPMGVVWLMVGLSMCLSFGVAWSWHLYDMKKHLQSYRAIDDAVILNTERITAYRDVLKEKGKEGGAAFLRSLPVTEHGN